MIFRSRYALPLALTLLFSPGLIRHALAQPPLAPSTVNKNPDNWNPGVPVPPPVRLDPPQITPEELQTLTGGPTLVTFSGTDVPLNDAVKALLDAAHRAANPFSRQFEKKTLSVDWQQTPFWKAAAQLETAGDAFWDGRYANVLSLAPNGGRQEWGLGGDLATQNPFVTLIANSVTRYTTRSMVFENKTVVPPPDRLLLNLTAYFDPKLQIQDDVIRALTLQKVGEAAIKAPATTDPQRTAGNIALTGSAIMPFVLRLPASTAPATKFSSISGVLHLEIAAATEHFTVPDIIATPSAETTIAGGLYQLQSATKTASTLDVQVRIPIGKTARVFSGPSSLRKLQVRDAQGRPLFASNSTLGVTFGTFSFRLQDAKGQAIPGPYSLDWPIVTATKSLDVPFELRDVTVP